MKLSETKILNKIQDWKKRGLLNEITDEKKFISAIKSGSGVYFGVDPTSPSLHIGHLAPIVLAKEINELGCPLFVLIGGFTARIGEPKVALEKSDSIKKDRAIDLREDIDFSRVEKFSKSIKNQLERLFQNNENIHFLNNFDWWKKKDIASFLEEVGSKFTLNQMLERKFAKNVKKVDSLTFSRFSYILLQAFDFFHLVSTKDCMIQVGGKDQSPNIYFGLELARLLSAEKFNSDKKRKIFDSIREKMCGVTTTLFEGKGGAKISKTDGNKSFRFDLEPFAFYQQIFNLDDRIAEIFLQRLLPFEMYSEALREANKKTKERLLQKKLGDFLIDWIFSKEDKNRLSKLRELTPVLSKLKVNFSCEKLSLEEKKTLYQALTSPETTKFENKKNQLAIWKIMSAFNGSSKSDTRRLFEQKGINMTYFSILENDLKIEEKNTELKEILESKDATYESIQIPKFPLVLLVKAGKNNFFILSKKN